jgi:predicted site-specific integrase-resolvase
MSIKIENKNYYRTAEVCQVVGISKATLFRWLKQGICSEAKQRDIRGWRLFTEEEVVSLMEQANRLSENNEFASSKSSVNK